MTVNLQRAASELAEKIAALPARYPYIGAAEKCPSSEILRQEAA
jgi:hypothetical protein